MGEKINKETTVDNKEFLWYGLYAFAGFGLEIVLSMLEKLFVTEYNVFTECIHWTLTSILWGLMAYILCRSSNRKLGFNLGYNSQVNKQRVTITVILILAALVIKAMVVGGVKLVMEYTNLGLIKFLFQYIYYFFETALIILTIAFGQRFFEGLLKKKSNSIIPFGGLFLACTWGIIHILTQDAATGLYAFAMAVVYGMVYVLLNKNVKYAYLGVLILFVL